MEDPRCKIAAIEAEDHRCKSLLRGVVIEMEDTRLKRLFCRMELEIKDPRSMRVTVADGRPSVQEPVNDLVTETSNRSLAPPHIKADRLCPRCHKLVRIRQMLSIAQAELVGTIDKGRRRIRKSASNKETREEKRSWRKQCWIEQASKSPIRRTKLLGRHRLLPMHLRMA